MCVFPLILSCLSLIGSFLHSVYRIFIFFYLRCFFILYVIPLIASLFHCFVFPYFLRFSVNFYVTLVQPTTISSKGKSTQLLSSCSHHDIPSTVFMVSITNTKSMKAPQDIIPLIPWWPLLIHVWATGLTKKSGFLWRQCLVCDASDCPTTIMDSWQIWEQNNGYSTKLNLLYLFTPFSFYLKPLGGSFVV